VPSRPGEFHPEPLTEPDLTLSRHPARATARRLPPSIDIGFLPLPVDPRQMAMTRSLRSTGITPLHHYKETDSLRRSSIPTTRQRLRSVSFTAGRRSRWRTTTKQPAPSRRIGTVGTAQALRGLERSWLETRRIPFAPQHYDARADTDTGVEVYDVLIGQPYAARGHERADGRWLIGDSRFLSRPIRSAARQD
jgi:hypothetical protein